LQFKLQDDFKLLRIMVDDARDQPALYKPGPYWAAKSKTILNDIRRCGIQNFRASSSLIGLSYADNLFLDIRHSYNQGLKKMASWATNLFPLKKVYESQLNLTRSYANIATTYEQEILNLKARTKYLLEKYRLPYSLLGGCERKAIIDGAEYSTHYINLLDQHDNIASHIRFSDSRTIFEIGGGFGVNIHLMLENYKNIRKILYLDIPPNLYVGTQYLKAFYGDAVSDYRKLRDINAIRFSDSDAFEMFCIAPWQVGSLQGEVDILMNAHSFVEMPSDVIANYAHHFLRLPGAKEAAIALTTYDGFDLQTTHDPTTLPQFFSGRQFNRHESATLLNSSRKNLYLISPGKFAVEMNCAKR